MRKPICLLVVAALFLAFVPAAVAEDGKTLFDAKCALCHGKDGVAKSTGKGSKNFNDAEFQKTATVESITKLMTDGKNKMPSFKEKLNAEQMKMIADHVKTLGAAK
ncbi:MAG: c-type cytochrome [Acidobacteria bacterium]|nr:c-type cytochrome [Acidobacteriota bacterium]